MVAWEMGEVSGSSQSLLLGGQVETLGPLPYTAGGLPGSGVSPTHSPKHSVHRKTSAGSPKANGYLGAPLSGPRISQRHSVGETLAPYSYVGNGAPGISKKKRSSVGETLSPHSYVVDGRLSPSTSPRVSPRSSIVESLSPSNYLGGWWSSPYTSPKVSPNASPRGSPWGSPRTSPRSMSRRSSRAPSREPMLEELIVVTVPCRELKVENVRLLDKFSSRKSSGTLYLTATHLIFVDPDAKKETWILHMHISSVDKLPLSTAGSPLQVRCKTFLAVTFVIPKERDCHDIYTSLLQLAQPVHLEDLYCFHYTASSDDLDKKAGWDSYDPPEEYRRMGVPNDDWVPTYINKNYEICDTYPQELFVPQSAQTKVILSSSKFRSKGRFPVLSHLHKNQAALCRSSQPLSGFSARCEEDEQLLDCILHSTPNSSQMYVVDTRPKINAMANRAAGKGYENEAFYENIKFHFSGIENIHVMRASLAKLVETCQLVAPSMGGFIGGVESSGWLKHIRSVLETALFISTAMTEGTSVLVHCSDGWDRTAQTTALAQLLLDPFYRTTRGFQVLVEKEWLSFGHKFTDRCGHIQGDSKEVSPIFTQFLDCVWQLQQMLPSAFEFNERYLLILHDHVYSAQFGTFIGNCQKDRLDLRLSERTYSFWGYVQSRAAEYRNPLYRKDSTADVLRPNLCPQNIRFWRGMYNRFENGVHPREPLGDLLAATTEHTIALVDQIDFLTKRMTWLKEEMEKAGRGTQGSQVVANHTDNRIINSSKKQYGSGNKGSRIGVSNVQEVEDSLVSVGALTLSGHSLPSQDFLLNDTSPNYLSTLTCKGSLMQQQSHQSSQEVSQDITTVSLDWKTFRNIRECSCSTPFDHFSRKYHCWRCGEVFCTRCIDKKTALPGHFSKQPVPVCRPCYKDVTRSLSVDTP